MTFQDRAPNVIFPEGFDARWEAELPDEGWLRSVTVQFDEGTRHLLTFYDPVMLRQELDDDAQAGRPFFGEPGLIVLPLVTRESIVVAVDALWREGYFTSLMPILPAPPVPMKRIGPLTTTSPLSATGS